MRPLNPGFCGLVNDMFKKYEQQVDGSHPDLWTKRMIQAVYDDWKHEKLSDAEFAHLIDNIMCR